MRIGYIMLCHKDPELVARIVNKVTEGTDNIVAIHVDLKSDIHPFIRLLESNSRAIFLDKRTSVFWGGFSSIVATMNALECARKYDCERYVLLQGADYPLHSNEYINDFFEKHKNVEFLKAYNITHSKRKINYMKCCGYHIFDGVDRSKKNIKTLCARGLSAINKLGIKYRKGFFYDRNAHKKYEIYWGWGHFALTRECIDYIMRVYKSNSALNRYFQHIFPADETYFQTIVYNSSFANYVVDGGAVDENTHMTNESMLNLTYFEYPEKVVMFDSEKKVTESIRNNYLFIRKISMAYFKRGKELCQNIKLR